MVDARHMENACRHPQEGYRDLVLLDLIMPMMSGGEAFDRIRELYPRMPVILASGYAIDGGAAEIMQRGCNGFIQKPYDIILLSQKVRMVLDESTGNG